MAVSLLKRPSSVSELKRPLRIGSIIIIAVSEVKRLQFIAIIYMYHNGHDPADKSVRSGVTFMYVTAVAVGQMQRLYSGVRRMVTWFYLSSININMFGWQKGVGLGSGWC